MANTTHGTENVSHSTPQGPVVGSILAIWAVTLTMGQLVRLPLFGQSGGILPSDIANIVVVVYAIYLSFWSVSVISAPEPESTSRMLGSRIKSGMTTKLPLITITPFLFWSLFVLLLHIGELPNSALLVSLSYWLRLAVTLALLPSFSAIFQHKNNKRYIRPLIIFFVASLVVLGYIQLLVHPSLQGISGGWDPHNFRMLSTWLDPNFFGVFLAIVLPYVVVAAGKPGKRRVAIAVVILLAILLTQSRSTFIAILVAGTLCGIMYLLRIRIGKINKRLALLGASIAIACIALGITLLGDRATNIFLHDPTTSIRSDAYKAVWRNLVEPNILLGVGYNAYQFAAKDAGLIADFSIHSRAGSDSSGLTLLVTTGIVGTTLFFTSILAAMAFHLRRFLQTQNQYSLCFLFATIVLLLQSQFTNSLLYPHILMTYILLAAISFAYD